MWGKEPPQSGAGAREASRSTGVLEEPDIHQEELPRVRPGRAIGFGERREKIWADASEKEVG